MDDIKVRALTDIWAFADLIDFRGGAQNFYQLHYDMAELNCANQTMAETKREYRRRIFLIPREHRKSTVNTILYTLWRVYRNPNIRIIIGCNVKELALDMIREMRAYLEDDDLVNTVWNDRPHIAGPLIPKLTNASSNYKKHSYTESTDSKVIWTAWALQVVRDLKDKQPTIQALSVGMKPTGKHCDLVVFDDIVDWNNSKSEVLAKKVQRWAHDIESVVTKKPVWQNICDGFGEWVGNEILINGTRYYYWDFYSKYVGNSEEEMKVRIAKTRYSAMVLDVYKNGKDNSDGYICPEIFDEEVERDLRETDSITKREWYAQFRNKIIAEEDASFKTDNIRLIFPSNYRSTHVPSLINFIDTTKPTETGYEVFPIRLYMAVDLAVSQSSRADNRAITVGGWDELRRLHVVDGAADKWDADKFYEQIHRLADKWNLTFVYYEAGVGYQDSFDHSFRTWQQLHNKRTLVPQKMPVVRTVAKSRKIEMALQPLLASDSLCISSVLWNHTRLSFELENFDVSSISNEDNMLDTIVMLTNTHPMISRAIRDSKDLGRHVTLNRMFGGTR